MSFLKLTEAKIIKPAELIQNVFNISKSFDKVKKAAFTDMYFKEIDFIGNKQANRYLFNFERELYTTIFNSAYGYFWMHSYGKYSGKFFEDKKDCIEDAVLDLRDRKSVV